MKRFFACLILVALLLATAGCSEPPPSPMTTTATAPQAPKPTAPVVTGKPLPEDLDFTVTDTTGKEVKLSDFEGTPVVVNFWATWCNPCTSELPDFDLAAKNNPNIQFMMINATDNREETPEIVSQFIADSGYRFDVFYDFELKTINSLGIQGFPTTFFIDAQGNVVDAYLGMIDAETLEAGLALIR